MTEMESDTTLNLSGADDQTAAQSEMHPHPRPRRSHRRAAGCRIARAPRRRRTDHRDPTDALAHILLHDSLKIHKLQAKELGQTGAVPGDLEQLQQRYDRLANEMESLAEEIERLEHEWKSQQQI